MLPDADQSAHRRQPDIALGLRRLLIAELLDEYVDTIDQDESHRAGD